MTPISCFGMQKTIHESNIRSLFLDKIIGASEAFW